VEFGLIDVNAIIGKRAMRGGGEGELFAGKNIKNSFPPIQNETFHHHFLSFDAHTFFGLIYSTQ
jgi:hypothetical protein